LGTQATSVGETHLQHSNKCDAKNNNTMHKQQWENSPAKDFGAPPLHSEEKVKKVRPSTPVFILVI